MNYFLNRKNREMVDISSFAVHQCTRNINGADKVFTWVERVPLDGGADYLVFIPDGVTIVHGPSECEVWFTPNIVQVTFGMGNFEVWTDWLLGREPE